MGSKGKKKKAGRERDVVKPEKLKNRVYEKELFQLQIELCKLQEWVKESGIALARRKGLLVPLRGPAWKPAKPRSSSSKPDAQPA